MKKLKTLAVALLVGCTLTASAQDEIFDNPDNRIFLGGRIGYDLTSVDGANNPSNYHNGSGFSLGAVYNIPIYMNLYFEPGLSFFYNTIGTSKMDVLTEGDIPIYVYRKEGSIRNFGFKVPLLVGYHFDLLDNLQVAAYTGPQLNMSLFATQYFEGERANSLFGSDGFKHFDGQWIFGVSVTFDRYVFTVGGGVGMTNIMDRPGESYRRNTFSVGLGYNF